MNDSTAGWQPAEPGSWAPQDAAVTDAVPTEAAVPEPEPEPDPADPAPLGVPRTPTGDAEADRCLERLADADHLAIDGHLEVYEDVHRGLRSALTALDTQPGPPPPTAHGGTTPRS